MKILILHAHPRPSASIAQRALLKASRAIGGISHHDLYAAYPDFAIDRAREQDLLLAHDIIVVQHPFYWYSSPAIIKEWQDVVLDYGWAYGPGGNHLHGKFWLSAITTGGAEDAYGSTGRNRFAVTELLAPMNQTAYLCGMGWLEPHIIYGGRRLEPDQLAIHCANWTKRLIDLRDGNTAPLQAIAKGYDLPAAFSKARQS